MKLLFDQNLSFKLCQTLADIQALVGELGAVTINHCVLLETLSGPGG